MRVGIIKNYIPFRPDQLASVVAYLKKELAAAGHEALVIGLPWLDAGGRLGEGTLLINRLYRLENIDQVIALEYPSCLVKHPRKVLWLWSQLPVLPKRYHIANKYLFNEFQRIYSSNRLLAQELKQLCGIKSKVLADPRLGKILGKILS